MNERVTIFMNNNITYFNKTDYQQGIYSNLTVKKTMMEWLQYSKNYIKVSTFQKYESTVHNHIIRNIGQSYVEELTDKVINDFIFHLLSKGNLKNNNGLSIKTVNDILIVLEMGLKYAEKTYSISYPKIKLLKTKYKDIEILSYSQQRTLEKFLLHNINIDKFAILLALYSGLRIGELCALQWNDILGGCITVSKTMLRIKSENNRTKIIITDPKTISSNRVVPLPKFILPIMEKFKQSEGYVISNNKGKFIEPRLMQIKFKKIITEAGLPDFNFHILRHSFATRCVEANFEVKSLSEILGHSNVKTTLNLYVHPSLELKRKNMNKLQLTTNI